MTSKEDLFNKPCEKLSAACVDAFIELQEDPTNPANLILASSWGESSLNMRNIVNANETITHLSLTDDALQYDREDGEIDCINGDALSHIISMQELKDVDRTAPLNPGMAYIWNGTKFVPQDISALSGDITSLLNRVKQLETSVALLQTSNTSLTQAVTDLGNRTQSLERTVANLTSRVGSLENRATRLEAVTAKPSYAPADAVLAWGNIDVEYNSNPTGKGIYTHNPSNNVAGDVRFD